MIDFYSNIHIRKIENKNKQYKSSSMKTIRIIATSEGRVLVISCPSDLPRLVKDDETTKEWFYEPPKGFHEFIHENPKELQQFIKAFGYWIEFRVKGFIEDLKRFEEFEEKVKRFSDNLLIKLRALASRIAKQVAKVLRNKSHYDEYREKKLNDTTPGLGTKRLTRKQQKTIAALQKTRSEYEKSHQESNNVIDEYFEN